MALERDAATVLDNPRHVAGVDVDDVVLDEGDGHGLGPQRGRHYVADLEIGTVLVHLDGCDDLVVADDDLRLGQAKVFVVGAGREPGVVFNRRQQFVGSADETALGDVRARSIKTTSVLLSKVNSAPSWRMTGPSMTTWVLPATLGNVNLLVP